MDQINKIRQEDCGPRYVVQALYYTDPSCGRGRLYLIYDYSNPNHSTDFSPKIIHTLQGAHGQLNAIARYFTGLGVPRSQWAFARPKLIPWAVAAQHANTAYSSVSKNLLGS